MREFGFSSRGYAFLSSCVRGAWELIQRNFLEGGGGLGPRLAGRAGLSALIGYTSYVLRFGVQLLLARLLGAEGFGEYIYVLAWISPERMPPVGDKSATWFYSTRTAA